MTDVRPLTASEALAEEFVKLHGPDRLPEDLLPPSLDGATSKGESGPEDDEHARLAALFGAIDDLDPRRAALCLSGGGIRSATFSLGVIQGLARAGWLPYFDYLSTVSGGGYIGGWLSAWIRRANFENAVAGLCAREAQATTGTITGSAATPGTERTVRQRDGVTPEPPQITWLRAYSNYLTPRLGFSADFWALVAVMLRNLLLHWVVFLPLLAAALMLPRITVALTVQLDPPGPVRWVACALALLLGAVAIAFVETDLPGSNWRPWPSGGFALGCFLTILAGAFLLSLF